MSHIQFPETIMTKTFQERMFEKVRDQISDLMTKDDLKNLVDLSIKKAFFEPAETKDRWGNTIHNNESIFITLIRKEMEPKVKEAIKKWLSEHPEDVENAIDNALAKGMFGLIQQHIETVSYHPMQQLAEQLRAKGVLG